MATLQERVESYNGFAIPIEPTTQLGLACDGKYQPIAAVATINEAREIAADDMRVRSEELEAGETPPCPATYVVWARGIGGIYCRAAQIEP